MKALILAAGMGSRLAPISNDIPKAMVPVRGKPILVKQIENLIDNGISDIAVVVGYKGDVIKDLLAEQFSFVHVIENADYDKTNNMYSAFMARNWISESPFIMMNGDVFFDSVIIRDLCQNVEPNLVCVDTTCYMDESMKVAAQDGRLTKISKTIAPDSAFGVSIDVYKFSKESCELFFERCCEYIRVRHELNLWSEVALNDVFGMVVFRPSHVAGRWYEIDTLEDLAQANRLFGE